MKEWKKELDNLFRNKKDKKQLKKEKEIQVKGEVENFYSIIVIPAFEELKTELEKHRREVKVSAGKTYASIRVSFEGNLEYDYEIKIRIWPRGAHPYPEYSFISEKDGKTYRFESFMRSGKQEYYIDDISKDEVIRNFLKGYESHIK